jgi:hypothetical protein
MRGKPVLTSLDPILEAFNVDTKMPDVKYYDDHIIRVPILGNRAPIYNAVCPTCGPQILPVFHKTYRKCYFMLFGKEVFYWEQIE